MKQPDITNYLNKTLELSRRANTEIYLVGGAVRNHVMNLPVSDYDFTCKGAASLAKEFSETLKLPRVPLDETPGRETVRVVLPGNIYFDFSELQGVDVLEDLGQRDFTCNSMAVKLDDYLEGNIEILDPFGGRNDLLSKTLTVLPGSAFESDPLRMLRAYRFAAAFGFQIAPDTLKKIEQCKNRIVATAPERIWYELVLFFQGTTTAPLLESMFQTGILNCIIPDLDDAKPDDCECILQSCKNLEKFIASNPPELIKYCERQKARDENRTYALLKISVLLHLLETVPEKIGGVAKVLKGLRASNADIQFVERTIAIQESAQANELGFSAQPVDSNKMYAFAKRSGDELIPALFLARAIYAARKGNAGSVQTFDKAAANLQSFYYNQYVPISELSPLLDGDDLKNKFHLAPSPLFKIILEQIEQARVLGDIKTREDAESLAQKIIDDQ